MKKSGASAEDIAGAVAQLQAMRLTLAEAEKGAKPEHEINRKLFDETVLRRMFVARGRAAPDASRLGRVLDVRCPATRAEDALPV